MFGDVGQILNYLGLNNVCPSLLYFLLPIHFSKSIIPKNREKKNKNQRSIVLLIRCERWGRVKSMAKM